MRDAPHDNVAHRHELRWFKIRPAALRTLPWQAYDAATAAAGVTIHAVLYSFTELPFHARGT